MKALTIRQPWASLIATGVKTIETRSRRTHYRGPIAIHAGKRFHEPFEEALEACHKAGFSWMDSLLLSASRKMPLGAVVATAAIVDCVPIHQWLCPCDHADGLYVSISPTSMQRGDIVGLFEAPSGAGVKHPDWAPSRLDCLDDAHPRQQAPFGDFRCGRWAWLLDNVECCDPILAKGRQGLWEWTP